MRFSIMFIVKGKDVTKNGSLNEKYAID
jgi:hypothetical protein